MTRISLALSGPRRAVVLMAVMFAVTLIAVAATAVLLRADSESSRTASILRYSQSRAAAWSGVRSVLAELQSQRTKLLQGETPEITGSWTLVEGKDTSGVVVRLVDLGPADGTLAQPEASKVNVNSVAEALLTASGVVSAAEAASIVEGRRRGVVASMTDLIGRGDAASGPAGITVDRLYGRVLAPDATSADAGAGGSGANSKTSFASSSDAGSGAGNRAAGGSSAGAAVPAIPSVAAAGSGSGASVASGLRTGPSALADVCTVFSADPNVQVGIAADAARYAGMARINLGLGWSDDLVQPITERFGKDAVETTKQLLQGGSKFKTMRDVVAVLRRLSVPIRQWGSLLDAFTTTSDPFVIGRIDLLRASEQVLGTVPGIDAAAAGKIVAVRDRLDAAARREITWPVLEGILTEDQFELAVDWITNRSMQWRVVVEAGRPRRAGAAGAGSDLADRVVLEAVLDVAAPRGRVAYLRDVSALQAMRLIAQRSTGKNPQGSREQGLGVHEFGDERDLSGEGVGGLPGGSDESTMTAERGRETAAAEAARAGPSQDGEAGREGNPAEEPMQDASTAGDSTVGQGAAPAVRTKGIDHRTGRWNAPRGQGGRP